MIYCMPAQSQKGGRKTSCGHLHEESFLKLGSVLSQASLY